MDASLTLRSAFAAGYELVAYCKAPHCSGRPVTAERIPSHLLDRPLAELVQARAFRCRRHPDAGVVVHVNRVHVGVSLRVAEFEQS